MPETQRQFPRARACNGADPGRPEVDNNGSRSRNCLTLKFLEETSCARSEALPDISTSLLSTSYDAHHPAFRTRRPNHTANSEKELKACPAWKVILLLKA
jgi:hypothetical protein